MGVISFVEKTKQQSIPKENKLDGVLGGCYQLIHTVHRLWRWYRRTEIYCNPDNLLKLAAGHSVNWLAGDRMVVNVAAQVVLVSTRITDCVKEQVKVVDKADKLWKIATSSYVLSPKIKWKKEINKGSWISLSSKIWWKEKFQRLVDYIKRLAKGIFSLFKRLFLLSMKTLDAAESFSYANNKNERLNELFVNSSKCLGTLVKNKDLLLHSLEKNRSIVSQVLNNAGSVFTVDQLVTVAKKTVGAAESLHNGIESASQAVGVVGRDLAKRAAFGLFQAAGLLDLMPNSWVPPLHPVWMDNLRNQKEKPPYPPVDDVKKPYNYKLLVEGEIDKKTRDLYRPRGGFGDLGYRFKFRSVEVNVRKRYAELCKMPLTEYRELK